MIEINFIRVRSFLGITFVNKTRCGVRSKLIQIFYKSYFEIVSEIIMYLSVIV